MQQRAIDPEDIVVREGQSVWITAGGYSVRVEHMSGGGAKVAAFVLGEEDGDDLGRFELGPQEF